MADNLAQSIEMYCKHLKTPTFNQYKDVIKQLDKNQGYEDFLLNLLRLEYDARTEKKPTEENQKCRISLHKDYKRS